MNQSDTGLALLLERLVRSVYDQRDDVKLHPVQWAAMRYFARAGQLTRTVSGLAGYLGITKGPASRSVGRLVSRGYLTSEVSTIDRRSAIITVTEEGRRALKQDPLFRLAAAISMIGADKKLLLAEYVEEIYRPLLPADHRQGPGSEAGSTHA